MEREVLGLYKLNTDGEDGSDDDPVGVLTISFFASIKMDLACNIYIYNSHYITQLLNSNLIQTIIDDKESLEWHNMARENWIAIINSGSSYVPPSPN